MDQSSFHFHEKKRVVVKIGSSSLNYEETGSLNFTKLEHLVRELCNLRNRGMDVCLVSSGAIAVGRQSLGMTERPRELSTKQACAAVGQARLMMIYQKLFAEYNQVAGQVLMTKNTMVNPVSRENAKNTFDELFRLGAIPIVNENDTVSTYEMQFGDNDTLSAIVASLIGAGCKIDRSGRKDGFRHSWNGKEYDRKRCRNRRHGDQADRGKDRDTFRDRYDHCKRSRCLCTASYF